MAIKCFTCQVTIDNCHFTQGGIGALNLGKGTFNDGGYFNLQGISEFTVKNSRFVDLTIVQIVELFNAITQRNTDPEEYMATYSSLIMIAEFTNTGSVITFDNVTVSFDS